MPEEEPPKTFEDDFVSDFDEFLSTSSSSQSTVFLSGKPNELCDRLRLIIQEKRGGNGKKSFDDENFAPIFELSE